MCNVWRSQFSRISARATQFRRNIVAVASRWRHCVRLDQPWKRTHDLPRRQQCPSELTGKRLKTQCRQWLAINATVLRICATQAVNPRRWIPATRYTLRRNTARIMKMISSQEFSTAARTSSPVYRHHTQHFHQIQFQLFLYCDLIIACCHNTVNTNMLC